ncbi:hypothetical protein M3Y99_01936800 [Aphelenchoides fujianensis]|nr:hypothetical protein M3Y99_01936800 [Aphelenchoides fujianensis]
MLSRSLLLVCLLSVWVVELGADFLNGRPFGGFFNGEMFDAFVNTTGSSFRTVQLPYETKEMVDEAFANWKECVAEEEQKSNATGGEVELQAGRACAARMKYDDFTLLHNIYGVLNHWEPNEDFSCERSLINNQNPKMLFYLLDAKRLCQTVQFMTVPYCTIREMCGKKRSVDALYGLIYVWLQFKANGFFHRSGYGDCPIGSSDIGRSLNPKLFTSEFGYTTDAIFVRDVCEQYLQPRTFAVAEKTQEFFDEIYAKDL